MRGLHPEERQVLIHLAAEGEDNWLDENDDAAQEIRDRLVTQGRVTAEDFDDEEGDPCRKWSISTLGRLALKVCP